MTSPFTWSAQPADDARMRRLLGRISAAPDLHARFLNTLALLEHVGSRKLMLSQMSAPGGPGLDTLKHIAEETRHAFFFKRAADAAAKRPLAFTAADILAGSAARSYIGRLDAFVARGVDARAAYLYVSLVIELRAIWFYGLYQGVLKEAGHSLNLTSVLAEENRHLAEMTERLAAIGETVADRLPAFAAFEARRFEVIFAALEQATEAAALPAVAE